jgi:hypothetical protein
MSIEMVRHFLLWCAVINYGVLLLWALLMVLPHEWMHRLWSRWYRLSAEQFDAISFAGIVFFKTSIIMFNLVPLVALYIIG